MTCSSGLLIFLLLLRHGIVDGTFKCTVLGLLVITQIVDFLQNLGLVEQVSIVVSRVRVGMRYSLNRCFSGDSLVLSAFLKCCEP